jgi:hypothetical protein
MMPNWFRDLVGIWRATPEILRAQRLFAQARNLRREGRVVEGFRTAIEAFGILRADAHQEHPAAQSLVATDAVLVDELARELGHSGAARDDLQAALKICEEISEVSPRLRTQLKQYIDWYHRRLTELDPDTVH